MADSTVTALSDISGATPAGIQTTDVFYIVRPGSPDADFKASGADVNTFAAVTLVPKTTTVNGHALSGNVTVSASDLTTGTLAAARGGAGTVNGIMKANGSGAVSQATSGTDYAPATTGTSILKALSGGFANAAAGTDYCAATSGSGILKGSAGNTATATAGTDYSAGTSGLATGILKSTTGTGSLTIAAAGTDYVAPSTTVNGHALSSNVTISASDITTGTLNGVAVTGLSTPSAGSDAANKSYVDAATAGLSQRASCRMATTAALTGVQVGNVFTYTATGVQTIDGVTPALNDRVLRKNETTNNPYNGAYTVTTLGATGIAMVLTRTTDYDAAAPNEIVEGSYFVIEEGTANAGTLWIETGQGPFTVGTTPIIFTELSVAPQTLTFTGNVTGTGASSIALTIGAAQVTNAMLAGSITAANLVGTDIATVGTITAGTWHGTAVADAYIASASTWNAKIDNTVTTLSSLVSIGTITTGTWSATTIAVNKGGTGLTAGTSGGILAYTGTGTLASSALLAANAVVVGGGAGVVPSTSPVTIDATTGAIAGFLTTFNNQTGTTYTMASTDTGKTVTFNNASAITVTLPNSLAIGFTCECIQLGAGQVTFSAGSGATLQNRQSQTKIAGQYGATRLAVTANSGGTAAVYNLAGDTA